jgi:three-Cys-motif partner protein
MKRDPFFESPKSWSLRKHRLLGKYLKPFSAKVGSWAKVIYCVDGFAGVGKYDDGSPGSPLLMAQLANECAAWQKPVSLRVVNVESNPTHFAELRQLTQKWEARGVATNLQGEFGKLVPSIIAQIGHAPAFFFVDPYGPSKVPFSDLNPILARPQRVTELIINFDVDGLRRIGDTIHSRTGMSRALKAAQTNIARVTEIIGSKGWQAQFKTGKLSTRERERALLQEYMNNLSQYGYMVVAYAIRKSMGVSPKYHLVYCTRHSDGIMLMNSFIREEEDELLREATTQPGQVALIDAVEMEVNRRQEEFKRLLLDYFRKTPQTTRGEIRRHFIFQRFGDFHDKDYNAVVQEFINIGLLQTGHGRKRINDNEPLTYTP